MRTAKILIVEDEFIICEEIKTIVESMGYQVVATTDSGEKAIELANSQEPDIVLMDIRINGELDGIETAEEIRSNFGIPVIFSTAYLDNERIERAKITMPFGYVLKPIQERDLKVTIEMALYVAMIDAKRKQAEDELYRTREQCRTLSEASFESIFLSEKGICLEQNQTAAQMFGYSNSEAIGKAGTNWIIPEHRDLVKSHMLSGYKDPYEVDALRKDGTSFPAEIQGKMIFFQGREVRVTALRDISKRKQTEEALQKSEDRYKNFFNSTLVGFFRSRISDGMFIEVNSKAAKMMARPIEEIAGKIRTVDLYRNPDQRRELVSQLKQHGEVHDFHVDLKLHDGRDATFSVFIKAFPDEDYMEGVMVDITK